MDDALKAKIRSSFKNGKLRIKASSPNGKVTLQTISDVMKHDTAHKKSFEVSLTNGATVICTEDHSLFLWQHGWLQAVETRYLKQGLLLAFFDGKKVVGVPIKDLVETHMPVTYDLCVPEFENFVLENGVVAHNSYSIGGISLDIDKSSKYMSLKDNAEGQSDKALEAKKDTVKISIGLQQPKYGIGIRSAFGSHVGKGILSPRNFV